MRVGVAARGAGVKARLARVKCIVANAVRWMLFEPRGVPLVASSRGIRTPGENEYARVAALSSSHENSDGMKMSVSHEMRYLDMPQKKRCMMSSVESRTTSFRMKAEAKCVEKMPVSVMRCCSAACREIDMAASFLGYLGVAFA